MQSKNKPKQTIEEREHVQRLAQMPCIICDEQGVEIHEPEQGLWFASLPLCPTCHRDSVRGWHGRRMNWKAAGVHNEIQALNKLIGKLL